MQTAASRPVAAKIFSFLITLLRYPRQIGAFLADPSPILRKLRPKVRKNGHRSVFSSDLGYLTNCQHSPARVLGLGPVLDWQFQVQKAVPVPILVHAHHGS